MLSDVLQSWNIKLKIKIIALWFSDAARIRHGLQEQHVYMRQRGTIVPQCVWKGICLVKLISVTSGQLQLECNCFGVVEGKLAVNLIYYVFWCHIFYKPTTEIESEDKTA